MDKFLSCAITGHRPTRFKFKYDENNTGCKRLKKRLHDQFMDLRFKGKTVPIQCRFCAN